MIFSHSRLSCFEQCPQKFRYRYIDKIKTETEETIEIFLGKRVHESLEKLYHDLRFDRLNSREETLEFFNSRWDKKWSDKILMVRSNNPEIHKGAGIKLISDYYNRHNPFNRSRTIGLEMPVKFDLDGFKMKGFIDRLSLAKNILEIHDYKTGGRMPAVEQLERDRQLYLYAMAAKKMFPFAEQTNLVWHFLAFDKTIEIKADEKRLELLKNDTIRLIEKINSEKQFPRRESRLCAWCEFQNICGNNRK